MTNSRLAAMVFIIALAVRMALFFACRMPSFTEGDSPGYIALAESIRQGHGFTFDGVTPTAERAPVYSLIIAGLTALFGPGFNSLIVFQLFLDSVTCALLFLLARKLLNAPWDLVCGLCAAFYLPMAFWTLYIRVETVFTFLLAACVSLISIGYSSSLKSLFGGVLLGLATMVRPNGIVAAVFIAIWFLLNSRWKLFFKNLILFGLGFILILTPWIIRNALTFNRFIPTSTITGMTFYNSYFYAKGGLGFNYIDERHSYISEIKNEADRSKELINITINHIASHPFEALKTLPLKLGILVYPYDMKWLNPSFPIRYNFFWGIVSLFFIVALFFRFPLIMNDFQFILFIVLSLLATTIVFYGSPRLRAPFDLFMMLIACSGAQFLFERSSRFYWFGFIAIFQFLLACAGEFTGLTQLLRNLVPW